MNEAGLQDIKKAGEPKWNLLAYKIIFPVILALYPLRHVFVGLDLWDVGYNYANFLYMGTEHMDPMWLFSTYLSTLVGHIMTMLPGGHTLLGMNIYTGLILSAIGVLVYFFCVKQLRIHGAIALIGVFLAESLSWCPTALVYNYLTYFLLAVTVILLYRGLTEEKWYFLVGAGVALGTNVLVRFSNLPQAVLIVGVWAYAIICRKKFVKVLKETGLCLAGYVAGIVLWFGIIGIRYGFSDYVNGIINLFAMTDSNAGYSPYMMVYNVYLAYRKALHWFIWVLLFLALSTVLGVLLPQGKKILKYVLCGGVSVAMVVLLYVKNWCSVTFTEYNAMYNPAMVLLMILLLSGVILVFWPKAGKEHKLIAGFSVLLILVSSIGSNNGVYTSINNLYIALPVGLYWVGQLFLKWRDEKFTGLKTVLAAFLAVLSFQTIGFGAVFSFVEARGAENLTAKADTVASLKGIIMEEKRAVWITELAEFVDSNNLAGKDVILYGNIPAVSFYLDLPSAFNPWSDLPSFSEARFAEELDAITASLKEEGEYGEEAPLVILEIGTATFINEGEEAAEAAGYPKVAEMKTSAKVAKLKEFLIQNEYNEVFSNDKFVVMRTEKRVYD